VFFLLILRCYGTVMVSEVDWHSVNRASSGNKIGSDELLVSGVIYHDTSRNTCHKYVLEVLTIALCTKILNLPHSTSQTLLSVYIHNVLHTLSASFMFPFYGIDDCPLFCTVTSSVVTSTCKIPTLLIKTLLTSLPSCHLMRFGSTFIQVYNTCQ